MALLGTPVLIFLLVVATILLFIPRSLAPLPLLVGACYMISGQGLMIGPFYFSVIRLLIVAGIVRVILRGERLAGGINSLDWLIIVWAAWALISLIFHNDPLKVLDFRLGLVYNTCGIYFLIRVFCQYPDDFVGLVRSTAILLAPLAVEMFYERVMGYNLFSLVGGVSIPEFRAGSFRAQGPFAHAILAGTVGAVCLPMMIGIWSQHRKFAILGIASCLTIIITSGSSGPILSALAGIGAIFLWRIRYQMRLVRWLAVLGYIMMDLIMIVPAYYLIARMDLGIGSTGYHRARLIQSAIEHLPEWWLAGTDYTRHWMATGVSWSPDHTDITNHYIYFGVLGGLPLMILFIILLAKGFSYVGHVLKNENDQNTGDKFFFWALGASLFAHAATMISVSYFDQSFIFLYLVLGVIGSLWSVNMKSQIVYVPRTELSQFEE